jgi:hypothetical protein
VLQGHQAQQGLRLRVFQGLQGLQVLKVTQELLGQLDLQEKVSQDHRVLQPTVLRDLRARPEASDTDSGRRLSSARRLKPRVTRKGQEMCMALPTAPLGADITTCVDVGKGCWDISAKKTKIKPSWAKLAGAEISVTGSLTNCGPPPHGGLHGQIRIKVSKGYCLDLPHAPFGFMSMNMAAVGLEGSFTLSAYQIDLYEGDIGHPPTKARRRSSNLRKGGGAEIRADAGVYAHAGVYNYGYDHEWENGRVPGYKCNCKQCDPSAVATSSSGNPNRRRRRSTSLDGARCKDNDACLQALRRRWNHYTCSASTQWCTSHANDMKCCPESCGKCTPTEGKKVWRDNKKCGCERKGHSGKWPERRRRNWQLAAPKPSIGGDANLGLSLTLSPICPDCVSDLSATISLKLSASVLGFEIKWTIFKDTHLFTIEDVIQSSACTPYSEVACIKAAEEAGLQLGNPPHHEFSQDWYYPPGCYAYSSGYYAGQAFYGSGAGDRTTSSSSVTRQSSDKYRPAGFDMC